jgi:deoxyribonuclease IV
MCDVPDHPAVGVQRPAANRPAATRRLSLSARRPIGAHVPVSGGLATGGLRYATAVAAEAIQVFVSNPRGWALATGDARQDALLREHVSRTGLPVFIHAPYLVNVGSPDPVIRQRSAAVLRHSLLRGAEIGALGVVAHTGSGVASERADALRRVRDCLLPVLDEIPDDGPDLLLEPMAGQGQMLCGTVGDLEPYLDALEWHPRANVCLDTCHVFAAGHDLTARHGVARLLRELQAAAHDRGGRLRLIHANDSRAACGSHRDLHENIGSGQLGLAAFAGLLHHPVTVGVPFVVETPGDEQGQGNDIATLRALRDAGHAARRPAGPPAGRGAPQPAVQSDGPSPGSSW